MHPRVKELYLNASVLAHQTEPTDLIAAELVRTKKFAELIVRECVQISQTSTDGFSAGRRMLEQFGIEP